MSKVDERVNGSDATLVPYSGYLGPNKFVLGEVGLEVGKGADPSVLERPLSPDEYFIISRRACPSVTGEQDMSEVEISNERGSQFAPWPLCVLPTDPSDKSQEQPDTVTLLTLILCDEQSGLRQWGFQFDDVGDQLAICTRGKNKKPPGSAGVDFSSRWDVVRGRWRLLPSGIAVKCNMPEMNYHHHHEEVTDETMSTKLAKQMRLRQGASSTADKVGMTDWAYPHLVSSVASSADPSV